MEVVITEWALNSYLDLKHKQIFTEEEYREIIRPDVELLKDGFPSHDPKFVNNKFWGPVADKSGNTIQSAFKMKWHQVGPGRIQLRLLVVLHDRKAFFCRAYVKANEKIDRREAAKLKIHIRDIRNRQFLTRGLL